jgi:hypothetical protein
MRAIYRNLFVGAIVAGVGLGVPAESRAVDATMTVRCLSGTVTNCQAMAFLLTTTPTAMVSRIRIGDSHADSNPFTFTLTGAQIFQGTSEAGTNVTSDFVLDHGSTSNLNLFRARDLTTPFVFEPLFLRIDTATPGSLLPLVFEVQYLVGPRDPIGTTPYAAVTVIPDTVVPEPATLLLLGTGAAGVAAARRRRRRTDAL